MLDLVTNDKGMTTLKYKIPTRGLLGRAVQVEHIRLNPGLKALGCQPVERTSLSKVLVSDGSTCTPTLRP